MALLIFLFSISVTATAWARLGETADQLVARYGQPLSEIDQKAEGSNPALSFVSFQKNGFQINVTLSNGSSAAESFKKLNGDPLTIGEVRALLTDNSQGYEWEAPQVMAEGKRWGRDDGAVATLIGGQIFNISSKELLVEKAVAKKLERQPSLEGF